MAHNTARYTNIHDQGTFELGNKYHFNDVHISSIISPKEIENHPDPFSTLPFLSSPSFVDRPQLF